MVERVKGIKPYTIPNVDPTNTLCLLLCIIQPLRLLKERPGLRLLLNGF